MVQIKKGLDLPISGAPRPQIEAGPPVSHVALLGRDYHEMKPALRVAEGDSVQLGQPLFFDKKNPQILFAAPGSGKVVAINRGERRSFKSLVIELDRQEEGDFVVFPITQLDQLSPAQVRQQLLESGLWTSFRTRPFSKIPDPDSDPAALFVTAIDTNPLAADPQLVIAENSLDFSYGLKILRLLSSSTVYLCKHPEAQFDAPAGIETREFSGVHPAGLVGTHIHFLEKVDQHRCVWHIGYQDVIAIGHLFLTGCLQTERIISLAGPGVKQPRLVRTRLGACLSELTADQLHAGEQRVVSGSVLSGYRAAGPDDYLGRYHNQVSVLNEGRQRELLGWTLPGFDKFSLKKVFASSLLPRKLLAMTTSTNGSLRAMVPIGAFEKVVPLNVKATWLLRSLLTHDTDLAQQLGCLELDEEDLALCSFVCSGKMDYGAHLRQTLKKIEVEG